jgi:pimeloyl-ACP methyl ester carboxylesterase
MPVLGKGAKYYDYVPIFPYSHERIDAAINFYKAKGIDNIVLIAHGCGAHMSMSYLDKYGDSKIKGYIGIGHLHRQCMPALFCQPSAKWLNRIRPVCMLPTIMQDNDATLRFIRLPMFGEFNPNKLRAEFNQFVGIEPDFDREHRLVNQIADAVIDGDVEYLRLKNGREIFSIFMESEADKPKGGIIILHNRGQHANWSDTIKPLRTGLTEKGWHTLSVQMPVFQNGSIKEKYIFSKVNLFSIKRSMLNRE